MIPAMKDSRGKPSLTLTFVTIAFVIVIIKFALSGLTIGQFGTVPGMDGSEFAMAIGAVLGIWWGREKTEKETSK